MSELIDKAKGAANVVAGKTRQAIGAEVGSPKEQAKGALQEAKGHVQKAKGAIEGAASRKA